MSSFPSAYAIKIITSYVVCYDITIQACDTSIEAVIIRLESDLHKMLQWFTDKDMKANQKSKLLSNSVVISHIAHEIL